MSVLALLYGSGRYTIEPDVGELRVRRDDAIKLAVEDVEFGLSLQEEWLGAELEEETA